jgi:cyclophilin family peptidyl-prolyl cis-trans isomerase
MKVLSALTLFAILASARVRPDKPGLYAVFNTSEVLIAAKGSTRRKFRSRCGILSASLRAPRPGANRKRAPWNIRFHRALPGQMIQSGALTGTGACRSEITNPDEFLPGLRFSHAGQLAVAHTGDPNSGGCQFFITAGPVPEWNDHYAILGEVVSGQDVVSKISHAPPHGDKPVDPAKLIGVAIELGRRPSIRS